MGIALHHQNENFFWGNFGIPPYTPNYASSGGVEVSAAMAEYNTTGTFTGTPLGGPVILGCQWICYISVLHYILTYGLQETLQKIFMG